MRTPPSPDVRAAQLESAEARFRTLFEHAPIGVLIADSDSVYLDANPAACRLFGYTREEFIGLHARDIVIEADLEAVRPALDAIYRDEAHRREWHFRRRDGSTFAADVTATKLPDETVLALITDVSERAEAHAYRERLAAIVEASSDAIVGTDLHGVITSWNAGAEAMFGWRAGEAVGMSIGRLIPPARRGEETNMIETLARGDRIPAFDTERLDRDGRTIDISITASPVRNRRGEIIGASRIGRDVRLLRARERELARLSRLYAALSSINQAIVRTTTRDELFQAVCDALVAQGGFAMAWVGWHDPVARRLDPAASTGDDTGFLATLDLDLGQAPQSDSPTAVAFTSGRPHVSNDLLADTRTLPWYDAIERAGIRAAACLPVIYAGAARGTLTVYALQEHYFHDREIALLEEAASDVAFALGNFDLERARREVDEKLRHEMAFSETMIDSMPGVLYFYDLSGRFLRWNRNFELVTGYSGDEIAAMHPLDFFSGNDRSLVESRIAEVFAAGESSVEAAFVSKDGSSRPFFFTGKRVAFEGRECLVGVGVDISQRREAEKRLEESERRARSLVERLSEHEAHLLEAQRIARLGSWTFDFATGELVCSDQIYAIAGIPAGVRSLDALFATTHPDDRGRLRAARRAAVEGRAPLDLEYRLVTADGTERVVHLRGSLTAATDGSPRLLSGTLHDITDRARMAAERERRHQAEAADRIKSAFLATMSHELRTPLNSILGFTGIVLQELAGPLTDEQKRQLGMARTSARHLLALVNDVLDISKIEAGQLAIASEPFDLRAVVTRAVDSIRPQAEARGLRLSCEVAEDLGALHGDERRVEQILLNLLSNAVKFTDHGRVTVSADVEVRSLPDGRPSQPAAVVRVADTGSGIRAADLPQLFQPFRQIDTGMARRYDGTGLGLVISRRLAGLMGGDVQAESEWGTGSTFTLVLPMRETS